MNIAFFGTSDRSIPILDVLQNNFGLALCVTKSDSIVGRKHELKSTEVKLWANKHKIEVVETKSLKSDENKIIERLKSKNIELGIVADFSLIIPQSIITTVSKGLINVHFSLLPKLRGASPVQFAILEGLNKTGISYFLISKGMDEGKVLFQVEYMLNGTETSGEMYKILFQLAADNITQTIHDYVNGKSVPQEQNNSEATYTYSKSHLKNTFIYKEDAQIDWSDADEYIEKQIRAFNPWPISWTTLGELQNSSLVADIGMKIKSKHNLDLKVKIHEAKLQTGKLKLTVVQPENGNKMKWEDFLNGYLEKTGN